MLDEIRLGEITLLHSVYEHINSNMYVLLAEDDALIIDPHKNKELTTLLKNKGVKRVTILLTHEHHDHTTGVYWYQDQFESTLICQQSAAEYIARRQYLRPTLIAFILGEEDHINGTHIYEDFKKSFVPRQYYADITYEEEYILNWHNNSFLFYHIPGHSQGSSMIVMNSQYAFSGDSLLKNLPIIIRFPGSNKADYENITMPLLCRLLTFDMTILPGHGDPFVLNEIMENNKIHVQFR
jgi:glyoxylase-like metal-dependent hydrolase (beta-lactamase superfamily II)